MNNEYKNLKYYNQKKGILKRKIAKRNTSNFEMLKYKEKYNKLYNQDKLLLFLIESSVFVNKLL